ncbi:AraC family transcriptional regulator [Parapedobacter sp. ISTM3]|uniref:helix-turn-helix domain-containing protein n=1 Tax=Parapedobacter sp. ISTM3 TaxID=2800130 RepID=UPI002104DF24|nr:helix-turn-helix transcriptional regulator [Parapedobacter sp. ISTM3]
MLEVKNKIEGYQYIKIARFKKDIRRTAPHRHNSYMEFIFLTKGGGIHTIDGRHYNVTPPVLFIVRQEEVHHWALEGEPEGYVMIIKQPYVDNSPDRALKALLLRLSGHVRIPITMPDSLVSLFDLLLVEWQYGPTVSLGGEIMEGLLKALLAKILQQAPSERPRHINAVDTFQRFEALLGETETLQNSVAHYAELLNTTPQNLNTACRKAVGDSATSVLARHIVNEAKRLLLYTDMTLGEIAAQLDFGDNSHFIKYFKRHTGMTPHAFRRTG